MSLTLQKRIEAFAELGNVISQYIVSLEREDDNVLNVSIHDSIELAFYHNAWFIKENTLHALNSWAKLLTTEKLNQWLNAYPLLNDSLNQKKVAVIMAGNIPLVGFHDFLSVLITGHSFIGKLSTDDKIVLPALASELCRIEPLFNDMILFSDQKLSDFDAVIATGSNNSARYFEFYFGKYKNIIRKNRNGVAVLNGNENELTMEQIGKDICQYFGLGCRSVSKVYFPMGYDPTRLYEGLKTYSDLLFSHNKYMNNYSYQRSIFLLNSIPHFDNGVLLLTQAESYSTPVSVINYEFYTDKIELNKRLLAEKELIQCVVSETDGIENAIPAGSTQTPTLNEYADGVDTIKFLTEL